MISEKKLEKLLIDRALVYGWLQRKVKWIGRNGAPDRCLMKDGRVIWIELKTTGERPTAQQAKEHQRMRDAGQCVLVIDTKEELLEVLAS